jgi:hypothetical protein
MFLDKKDVGLIFPHLKDENWKTVLTFLVDVLEHLNNLNLILQGKYLLVHKLYKVVQALKTNCICS